MADDLKVSLGVELDGSYDDVKKKIDDLRNGNGKDNKIQIQVDTKQADAQIKSFKNSIQGKTPAKIVIDVNKSVSNANITAFRNSILSKFTSNPVRMIIDVNKGQSNANLKAYLDGIKNQLQNIPIALTPETGNGSGSGNKGGSGNTPTPNVPNNIPTQPVPKNIPASKGGFVGTSKLIERGSVDEWGAFVKTGEVEKTNLALGETVTIYRELNEETQEFDETSRQYETNYEAQAKAAGKAAEERKKQWTDQLKYNSKQLELEQKWKDDREKLISEQNIKVADLESKAFNQATPLTGEFETKVKDAITPWTDAIKSLQSGTGKVTSDMENKLKALEATANRVFKEQRQAQHGGSDLTPDDISMRVLNAGADLDVQAQKLQQMGMYSTEVKTAFDGLRDSLGRVQDVRGFNEWKDAWQQINNEVKLYQEEIKTANKAENFKLDTKIIENQLENLRTKYEEIVSGDPSKQNTEIEDKFRSIADALQNVDVSKLPVLRKQLQELRTEVNGLQPQTLGQVLQENFGGIGQYLSRFVSTAYLIQKAVGVTKKMVGEVTSVDSSLVELQKVTTLTGDSLDQFVDKAYKVGEGLGRTGKDVVDAVTTFSRAGYDLNESTQLAQSALVMSNVGVDIPNMEAAASDMISILRAYDKEASESMQVIDELYNVANKEPLDFGNITDMLVTAGGTLAQTNTSLEESMGLLTGAFATMRDTSVANGLIMISQRLRGVKEDGEAIEEEGFMPKLQKAFGDVGVSIQDQNGELRSTFDILQDLAGVWDTLSSKQKQYLGEKAAGNRQVKTLNAIMANWDVVQDTIDKANEATGAATEGNEKYLDSIQGRITAFQSAFQNLARTTIDSGFIKGIVSIGTEITNTITKLGGLVPVLTTISGIIMVLKGAKIASGLAGIGSAIKVVFDGLKGASGILASLSGGIGMLGITAIVASIVAIVAHINNAKKSFESLKSTVDSSRQKVSDQKNVIENLNTELDNTNKLIANLEGKDTLTVVEQAELDRLRNLNKELENNIRIEETRLGIAQRQETQKVSGALQDFYDSAPGSYNKAGVEVEKQEAALTTLEKNLGLNKVTAFVSQTNKEIASLDKMITKEDVFLGKTVASDRYFDDVINAYNSLDYVQDKYIKSEEQVITIEDELARARKENPDAVKGLVAEYDVAKAYSDYYEVMLQDRLAVLADYNSKVEEILGDQPRYDNPQGQAQKNVNAAHDVNELVKEKIVQATINDAQSASDYVLGLYKDDAKEIQQIVKETGEITKEQLINQFPDILQAFENFGSRFGFTSDNIAKHLTEVFTNTPKTEETDTKSISSIDSLIEKSFLATDSYKNLTAAMTEQQKAGAISIETYQKLVNDKEGLTGIANCLMLTAEGYALNTEAVYDYIKAQNDNQKLKAIEQIVEKQKAIEELEGKYADLKNAQASLTELGENAAQREGLQSEIDELSAYIRELDSATGALERYKAAKSTANDDEDYKTGQSALKDIQEGWKTGKVGTDDYKEAMGFFLGDSYGTTYKGKEAQKKATQIGNRYFKNEKKGANTFANDLVKAGLATEKDGVFTMNEGVTLDSVASGLAKVYDGAEMSTDAVASLFKLLQTYSDTDFEWPEFLTPEEQKAAEERKKKIEELGETETQIKDKIAEKDKEIEEAEKNGQDTTELKQQKSNLEESLKNTTNEKETLESGASVDASTTSLDEAIKKLGGLKSTIETLNSEGINVPFSIQGEYDALKQTFTDIDNLKNEPTVSTTLNVEGNAEKVITTVETGLAEVGIGKDAPLYLTGDASEKVGELKEQIGQITDTPHEIKFTVNNPLPQSGGGSANQGSGAGRFDYEGVPDDAKKYLYSMKDVVSSAIGSGNKATIGQMMQSVFGFGGSVDLTNRPQIPASVMRWHGYDVDPNGPASTVYSMSGNIGENGDIGVVLTPILPDGSVITKEGMDKVFENLFVGSDGKVQLPEGFTVDGLFGEQGINLSDILISSFNLSNMSDSMEGKEAIMNWFGEYLHQMQAAFFDEDFDPNDIPEGSVKVPVEPQEGSGGEFVDTVQEEVNDEEPVEVPEQPKPVEPPSTPTPTPTPTPTQTPAPTPAPTQGEVQPVTQTVTMQVDDSEVQAYSVPEKDDGTVKYSHADFSSVSGLTPPTLQGTIKYTAQMPGNAAGTSNASKGPSLVDEKGAELIEHISRGTYELGTNKGARLTYLDKGDVVHTAKETKTILSRMAKVGGFFRDGLNKGKSIIGNAFARGISGSISLSNIRRVQNSARSKIKGTDKSKNSSGAKGLSNKKFQQWAEKLFDWAEIRLERLKSVTNGWLLSAAEAIGYIAKNKELSGAIGAVQDEIKATTAAYDLYIKQADAVQKKGKLSNDIVKKIQQGNISIGSYKKEIQEKIKEYQKWYDKAIACSDALNDLREQERDLAKQRLDNIIQYYSNRVTRLDNTVRLRDSEIDLMNALGKELQSSEYNTSISSTTDKLKNLVKQREALSEEMKSLVEQGLIEEESDDWFDYQAKIQDVENSIVEVRTSIIELQDTINKLTMDKLGWQLDRITNSASAMSDMMDLHAAQGIDELAEAYQELIENGMEQIKNLEAQNEEYRKQQEGLDAMSEKYQELEQDIQNNISAINDMKVSQEGWNDAVLDLKIAQLEKYRDGLNKMNDQYQRQKELQEAIEELQKAQSQRTQKIYKDGVGFVYEADQDAVKDAQENLESVIEDQLLSRIDDLIDALGELKNDTNVYDAQGNLLGTAYSLPQLGSLTDILTNYYNSNVVPNFSGLKGSLYDQIVAGAANNQAMQFNFGDINLSDVNDVETLGAAIVDLLPNAILQAMNKKS